MDYNLLYLEYANLMMFYIPIQRFSSLNNITYFNGEMGGGEGVCLSSTNWDIAHRVDTHVGISFVTTFFMRSLLSAGSALKIPS